MKVIFLFWAFVGVPLLLTGCSMSNTKSERDMHHLDKHVIRLNRDGLITKSDIASRTISQTLKPLPLPEAEARENIENIFKEAERLADSKSERVNNKTVVKLLIYVHGGLNFFNETDKRVDQFAEEIENDKDGDWAYPVFFSWPSSFPGTYSEHLLYVREGRKAGTAWGLLSSPFVLLADVVKSVGKYPLDVYYQLVNIKDNFASGEGPAIWLSHAWKQAEKEYCSIQNSQSGDCETQKSVKTSEGLQLRWSSYYPNNGKAASSLIQKTITAPLRYTLGTLGQSSIAAASWKNMKRRTSNIFYPTPLFDDREDTGIAGGEFFKSLFERIKNNKQYTYQINLVGHSMGTIVLNNALKKYRNDWVNSLALRNIVYMAAACSINDVIESVFPLLKALHNNKQGSNNPVNFYNLTLNRVAEISETTFGGVAPTGSLLVYIDQHLETPDHPFDRTFGSEVNVLSSLTALKDELKGIESHIQFKAFDSAQGYIPSKHGDFSDAPFWNKRFWNVLTKESPLQGSNISEDFNAYPDLWHQLNPYRQLMRRAQ